MKPGIHPEYAAAKITCACGRVTEGFSTVGEIHVEICSHCHPFFTGKQKLVDTAGRVERFRARYGELARPRKTAPAPEASASKVSDAPKAAGDAPQVDGDAPDVVAEVPEAVEDAAEEVEAEAEASADVDAGDAADETDETEEEPTAGEA